MFHCYIRNPSWNTVTCPTKKRPNLQRNCHYNSHFLDVFPNTVIKLLVFTHSSPSQPDPITRHLFLSAERPVLLVSKISHQQVPLCGMRQREADRSPELSHYSLQTAEDNRNKLNLCWTVEFEKGYWTLKALLTMKKPLSVSHQTKTLVHFVPKNSPHPPTTHAPFSFYSCHWRWCKWVLHYLLSLL